VRGAILLTGGAPRDGPLRDGLRHAGSCDTRTFHEALERYRGMFPTEVQIPNPLALDSCEHRLPWVIRCITPKRERRARPVHTESTAWTVCRCDTRENGFDPWQRLQHPGFWRTGSRRYALSPTKKRGEDAGDSLLPTRRIPQTLQAIIRISETAGVVHVPPDARGVLAEELGVGAIAKFGDDPTFYGWQFEVL
jgi:hypothetical protein